MRIGICPGSFDPVTNGHIDIFERASKLVDKLIIAVFTNPNKKHLFTLEERAELLAKSTAHISNIEVDFFSGLLIDYVKQKDNAIIIRGLRALSDFEYEFQRALLIKNLDNNIETVFIMTNNKYSFVSSSGVREIAHFGGDVGDIVPEAVKNALNAKYKK